MITGIVFSYLPYLDGVLAILRIINGHESLKMKKKTSYYWQRRRKILDKPSKKRLQKILKLLFVHICAVIAKLKYG